MKLDRTYSAQVTVAKYAKKAIKGVEDKKEYKRVGHIQVEYAYAGGDLDNFVDASIADDNSYTSCNWNEEIIGKYELDVNDVISEVKIIKISRKNKSESSTASILFETENLENVSVIGNYLKDKDNPAQVKLTKL